MDPGIMFFIIPIAVLAIFIIIKILSSNHTKKLYRSVAEELNLTYNYSGLFGGNEVYGEIESLHVNIKQETSNKKTYLKIIVYYQLPTHGDLSISRETGMSFIAKKLGKNDILTGDEQFDDLFLLKAAFPYELVGLLDQKTRQMIYNNCQFISKFTIFNDQLHFYHLKSSFFDLFDKVSIIARIMEAVKIALQFSSLNSIEERMALTCLHDSNLNVRFRNLDLISAHYKESQITRELLNTLLKDPLIEMQTRAAIHLRKEGLAPLYQLLQTRKLNDHLKKEIVIQFGKYKYQKSVPYLLKNYQHLLQFDLRIEILKALQKIGTEEASPFLLDLMEKSDHDEIIKQAIQALGSCGTPDAVEPLYLKDKKTINPFLKNTIKESIAKIQSRIQNGEKGWISMEPVKQKDGAVSLTDEMEGAVSVDPKPENDKRQ